MEDWQVDQIVARRRLHLTPAELAEKARTEHPAWGMAEYAQFEYLVKFQGRSYLHCKWCDIPVVVEHGPERIKMMLNRFTKKWNQEHGDEEESGEYIDPSFLQVDKILAEKEVERLFPIDSPLPPRLARVLGLGGGARSPAPGQLNGTSASPAKLGISSPGYTDGRRGHSSSSSSGSAAAGAGSGSTSGGVRPAARRSLGSDDAAAVLKEQREGARASSSPSASAMSGIGDGDGDRDGDGDGSPAVGAQSGSDGIGATDGSGVVPQSDRMLTAEEIEAKGYMPEDLANKTRLVAYESVSARQARQQGGKYRVIRERAFLVKWTNLPDSYNTWEFATDLDDDAKVLAYRRLAKPPSTARLDPGRRLMGCNSTPTSMQLAGLSSGSAREGLLRAGARGRDALAAEARERRAREDEDEYDAMDADLDEEHEDEQALDQLVDEEDEDGDLDGDGGYELDSDDEADYT